MHLSTLLHYIACALKMNSSFICAMIWLLFVPNWWQILLDYIQRVLCTCLDMYFMKFVCNTCNNYFITKSRRNMIDLSNTCNLRQMSLLVRPSMMDVVASDHFLHTYWKRPFSRVLSLVPLFVTCLRHVLQTGRTISDIAYHMVLSCALRR